jgi:hypothetical protein
MIDDERRPPARQMSATLELGAPARALVAVPSRDDADASTSRWYAATNALREGRNFLRLIERDVETKTAVVSRSIALDHRACEDVDVNASATQAVVTYEDIGREVRRSRGACVVSGSLGGGGERDATTQETPGAPSVLELRAEKGDDEREFETVKCARFNASGETVMTVDEFAARAWRRREDGGFASSSKTSTRSDASRSDIIGGMNTRQDGVSGGAWDPHEPESFACGVDADVVVFDARSARRAQTVERAHARQTRDVRYNPNTPHEMMTCGDDGLLKFWDARAHERALKVIAGHDHWIWSCAYNPVYAALALTASSDGTVRVWCDDDALPSDATASSTSARERGVSSVRQIDRRTCKDFVSARACAWSASDPWAHAAVTADGAVLLGEVPREEKYRILL